MWLGYCVSQAAHSRTTAHARVNRRATLLPFTICVCRFSEERLPVEKIHSQVLNLICNERYIDFGDSIGCDCWCRKKGTRGTLHTCINNSADPVQSSSSSILHHSTSIDYHSNVIRKIESNGSNLNHPMHAKSVKSVNLIRQSIEPRTI